MEHEALMTLRTFLLNPLYRSALKGVMELYVKGDRDVTEAQAIAKRQADYEMQNLLIYMNDYKTHRLVPSQTSTTCGQKRKLAEVPGVTANDTAVRRDLRGEGVQRQGDVGREKNRRWAGPAAVYRKIGGCQEIS